MRRIVLTSSQVSFLLSAFIILSCTVALFLSGYVIQQRTLRDLRTAIRPRQPRPKPMTYLPDHFKATTETLEDGTIIQGESVAERHARGDWTDQVVAEEEQKKKISLIEVSPSVPESGSRMTAVPSEKIAIVEQLKAKMTEKSWAVEHPDPLVKSKVPITRAERRRLIKEEIQRLSQSDEQVYYQRRLW